MKTKSILFLLINITCGTVSSQSNDALLEKNIYSFVNFCFGNDIDSNFQKTYGNGQVYCDISENQSTFTNKINYLRYFENGVIANRIVFYKVYETKMSNRPIGVGQENAENVLINEVDSILYCSSTWQTFYKNGSTRSFQNDVFGERSSFFFNKKGKLIYYSTNSRGREEGLIRPEFQDNVIVCKYFENSILLYYVNFDPSNGKLLKIMDKYNNELKSRGLKKKMIFYYSFLV